MAVNREKHYSPPGPVATAFHKSEAFVRCINGPIGSGKSTSCVIECLRLSALQPVQYDGVRRSRGAIIRNFYPDLIQTTMPTWLTWCPDEYNKVNWMSPPTQVIKTKDLEIEVIFLALDKEEDVRKLMGLELTWAWVNEARFVAKPIIDALQGRVSRYPSMSDGGCVRPSILCDTNPPDTEHWWYKIAERADEKLVESVEKSRVELVKINVLKQDQPLFEFFSQPSGLSPQAENVSNLRKGYYHFASAGKSEDWIKVYVHGEYGFVTDGRPVYPMFRDSAHVKTGLLPLDGLPLLLGVDLGLTPAAVIGQKLPDGRLRIVDEFVATDCGIVRFAGALASYIAQEYPGFVVGGGWLDPAGRARDSEEKTAQEIFKVHTKWDWHYAQTNDFQPRREVVISALNRMVDGEPGLVVAAKCKLLREGAISKYHFKMVRSSNGAEFHEIPVKNAHSHPHEALQYLVMGAGEYNLVMAKESRTPRQRIRIAPGTGDDPFEALKPRTGIPYSSAEDIRKRREKWSLR